MKAAIYTTYGPPDVVQIQEVPKPSPRENEILIKTHASTVTSGDWRARSLELPTGFGLVGRLVFGLLKPSQTILGTELAGVVEATGPSVNKFKVGDKVFAFSGAKMGCHAEYKCMPEDGPVVLMPENLTFEEAAALSFGGSTVLDFFRRAKLRSGDSVLINGASGAVGTAAVQIAKHLGAVVTGVCSTTNVDLVQSLGATKVIDYTQDDFTQNGESYDVIVDTAGTAPFKRSKKSLTPNGRLLVVLGGLLDLLGAPIISVISHQRVIAGPASERIEDLHTLAKLSDTGVYKPVIDRSYSLDQIVDAHHYVDTGHKRGNVVIIMKQ